MARLCLNKNRNKVRGWGGQAEKGEMGDGEKQMLKPNLRTGSQTYKGNSFLNRFISKMSYMPMRGDCNISLRVSRETDGPPAVTH